MKNNFLKKNKFFKDMTLIEFSIFLMVIITLIVAMIYFIFFREMQRELKTIEFEEYGIIH